MDTNEKKNLGRELDDDALDGATGGTDMGFDNLTHTKGMNNQTKQKGQTDQSKQKGQTVQTKQKGLGSGDKQKFF